MDKRSRIINGGDMEETRLDRSQIVHTALEMMKSDGVEGLSMRKLGARLNIRAPTLYWYFPDRSSILREVIKTLLTDTISRVPECDTWQAWLKSFGLELWHTNRNFPYVTILLQSAEFNDQEIFELAIKLLENRISHFDVNRLDFLRIHSDIQVLVLGWAVFQHAGVVNRLETFFDVDTAVTEAIDGIIAGWDRRIQAR